MVPKQVRLYFGNRGELTILSGEVQFAWWACGECFWKERPGRETGLGS